MEQANSGWLIGIRSQSWVRRVNRYLASPWFVILISALTVVANVFGAELYVYSFFVLCGLYISILGGDYLPIMPMVICSYIAPSLLNNPGREPTSIFYPQHGGIYIISIAAVFAISVIIRLSFDKELGGKNFLLCKRRLLPGILLLGGAYVLAGAFSGRYFERGWNNLIFALLQFLSVFLAYWFFAGAVKWEKARRDYIAWTGLGAGLVVLLEILNMYIVEGIIVSGAIDLHRIAAGWGNANNIGCILAMMIPFAYCLACQRDRGWVFSLLGILMSVGVVFTCSRASILGAVFAVICSFGLSLGDTQRRKSNTIATLVAVVSLAAVVAVFYQPIFHLFRSLIDKGIDPSFRDVIYEEGWKQFLKYPVFGGTFYPVADNIFEWSTLESFTSFFPARWHNTVIQLLASCGAVGMAAYTFHRVQTVKMFWEKRKTDTVFIGLSLATLLLMSLLDCHMFNIGPVLFYSMALAFAEKCQQ